MNFTKTDLQSLRNCAAYCCRHCPFLFEELTSDACWRIVKKGAELPADPEHRFRHIRVFVERAYIDLLRRQPTRTKSRRTVEFERQGKLPTARMLRHVPTSFQSIDHPDAKPLVDHLEEMRWKLILDSRVEEVRDAMIDLKIEYPKAHRAVHEYFLEDRGMEAIGKRMKLTLARIHQLVHHVGLPYLKKRLEKNHVS